MKHQAANVILDYLKRFGGRSSRFGDEGVAVVQAREHKHLDEQAGRLCSEEGFTGADYCLECLLRATVMVMDSSHMNSSVS